MRTKREQAVLISRIISSANPLHNGAASATEERR